MNSSSRFIIFVIVSQWAVECSRDAERLTIIAHGTNDLYSVEWAIAAGANSVEGDLQFDLTTGDPTMFYHGNLCDCLCYELTFANKTGNVCSIPNVCTRSTPPDEWLSILLGFPSLSMIYIDSKTNSLSVDVQRLAGPKVIRMVESNLFDKGFKGNVVIGSKLEKQYLEAVATQAHKSVYASRIFLTYDEGKTDPTSKLDFLKLFHIQMYCTPQGHRDVSKSFRSSI
ncbi:unnamed protein product [Meganyctiphanes norvegica]|uniref:Uncharacterized protein n=1 Tax=Meganyctiphanes norvegica TaxID=48144 RepID=A0AAV2RU12_MEGNR